MPAPRSSSSFRGAPGAASSRGGSVGASGPPSVSGGGAARRRDEDDGLDQIGPSASSHGPTPSVVVAPHAEEVPAPASHSRKKRGQEPTLVIRDRRQVQEIRAQVEQIGRRKAASRRRSILLWIGAGLTAFALGGVAVSVLGSGSSLASSLRGGEAERVPVPAAPARSTVVQAASTPPAVSGAPASASPVSGALNARAEAVGSSAASLPAPVAASSSTASAPQATEPSKPTAPAQPAAASPRVLALDELSDAAKKKAAPAKAVVAAPARPGNVVSLDDLPTE